MIFGRDELLLVRVFAIVFRMWREEKPDERELIPTDYHFSLHGLCCNAPAGMILAPPKFKFL